MTKKTLFLSLCLLTTTLSSFAAKSSGNIRSFAQPDGTQLKVQLLGDEYFDWYQTPDGALLMRTDAGFCIAQTNSNGELYSTGILAHDEGSRSAKELLAISLQNKELFFSTQETESAANGMRKVIAGYPKNTFCPHNGTVRVPIILMNYADTTFTLSDKAVWENYFNGETTTPFTNDTRFYGYSSVHKYFSDASHGKLNFVFDIYGPYTTDKGHHAYGKASGAGSALLKEAVLKADADIDFTQYDSNNDGRVDMVYVVYAGTGANLSNDRNDFWPSCYFNQTISTSDGMTIPVIGGASELAVSAYRNKGVARRSGIGITCHEMSHGMGLPDLYNTLSTTPTDAQGYVDPNNCGPEEWDLMDGGENLFNAIWPCQYTAWEKEIMGWIDLEELNEPKVVTLLPLNQEGGKAYRVTNPANPLEYYVIENYQDSPWNQYITSKYGTGLMITHVNLSKNGLAMSPNNVYGKPNVTLLPADDYILALYSLGETINYKGEIVTMPKDKNQFYKEYFVPDTQRDPYQGTKSDINVTSVAAYKNYTGEDMVNTYPITHITRNSDGSISFRFMRGATGDANDNGVVNVGDITATVGHLLDPEKQPVNLKATDTDGDGKITKDDVQGISDIILKK